MMEWKDDNLNIIKKQHLNISVMDNISYLVDFYFFYLSGCKLSALI